jgi:hypothetical protein
MNFDITPLLEQWDYHPGQVVVRRFKGKDGKHKIQLRVDLGILQMNAEGRPDGKRPFGQETYFDHLKHQLEKHRTTADGTDNGFRLKAEDVSKLQQEAIQYHHRYICLFQLGDFGGVLRDADRNLTVFEFVQQYAESEDLAWSLQQFKPQLLMMRIRAEGSLLMEQNDFESAVEVVEKGLEDLRAFYQEIGKADQLEQSGEVKSLEAWLLEIRSKRPLSTRERLEEDLREAVQQEDYERAARVRDLLKNLKEE